ILLHHTYTKCVLFSILSLSLRKQTNNESRSQLFQLIQENKRRTNDFPSRLIFLHTNCNGQPTFHSKRQTKQELRTFVLLYVQLKPLDHSSCNIFHLNKSHIFSETHSGTGIEYRIQIRTLWPKNTIFEPPFWPELMTILPPNALHSSHGVGIVRQGRVLPYKRPIW
ncbi:hypothetical protein TorRG33x02_239420, partial [Trema orientale]